MILVANVHLYGQKRLQINVHFLNKISDFEFAKPVQKLTKKKKNHLPPNLTSPQKTTGCLGDNSNASAYKLP